MAVHIPAHRRAQADTIPTTAARWMVVEVAAVAVDGVAAADEAVVEVGIITNARVAVDGRIGNKGRDIKGMVDSNIINNNRRLQPRVINQEPLTNPAASRCEVTKYNLISRPTRLK